MLNAFIFLYLSGHLVFTTMADFDKDIWCEAYYVWQNIAHGGVLAWGAIYSMGKVAVRIKVKWVFVFSILMFLWNLGRLFANIDVNDSIAVMIAFLSVVSITAYLTLLPEGKAAKFLSKHLLK